MFVVGTVFVFWLAHIYAAVVASRAAQPPLVLRTALARGIRHTYGMLVAMLIPALLLWLGVIERGRGVHGVLPRPRQRDRDARADRLRERRAQPQPLVLAGRRACWPRPGSGSLVIVLSIVVH